MTQPQNGEPEKSKAGQAAKSGAKNAAKHVGKKLVKGGAKKAILVKGAPVIAIILAIALIIGIVVIAFISLTASAANAACNPTSLIALATNGPLNAGDSVEDPLGGVLEITEERMANVQAIVRAGLFYVPPEARHPHNSTTMPVPPNGIIIAIATALPESKLININGGDRDSVGLFQQRPSQGWGTIEQIMDPIYSATKFYDGLLALSDWQTMDPGAAAQAVQRSAHPDRYAKYMEIAASLAQSAIPAVQGSPLGIVQPGTPAAPANSPVHCNPAEGGATPTGSGTGPNGEAIPLSDVPGIGPINSAIAASVAQMLIDAEADGVTLSGSSYRSYAEQVGLREKNCGSSNYAIYEMPSGQCSPPTARPGNSQHELGLAIDFNDCSHRSACFGWLSSNAAKYGLKNFPRESWHWSTTGN